MQKNTVNEYWHIFAKIQTTKKHFDVFVIVFAVRDRRLNRYFTGIKSFLKWKKIPEYRKLFLF